MQFLGSDTSLFSHGPWANGLPCEQSFHLSSCVKRRERGNVWVRWRLWGHSSPNFWTSQSCSLLWNCFFECKDTWIIDKPMIMTEPTISLKQHAAHAQQRSYLIHAESFLSTSSKLSGSPSRVQMKCFQSGFKKRDISSTLYIVI